MSEKICVIGAGVSGLVSAYLLSQKYEVTLLEANDYLGGHTNTEEIEKPDGIHRVNTGFIVFNKENYTNFLKLMEKLDVDYQPAPMSFSVKCHKTGLEYCFSGLDGIFAQRKNFFSLKFHKMLREIFKFRKEFVSLLDDPASAEKSVGEYLEEKGYSRMFIDKFLVPFGAAIWSADFDKMGQFPLQTFVQFFQNHGFLSREAHLQWYTLKGGSASYVKEIIKPFADNIHLNTKVTSVKRSRLGGVKVKAENGFRGKYDRVVLAVHSDQALEMLNDPSDIEQDVLGKMPYQPNSVVLHEDIDVLPKIKKTWSAWNYSIPSEDTEFCTVSYDMNILQSIESDTEFVVTLNQDKDINPDKVIKNFTYAHPVYTQDSVTSQGRYDEINGTDRIYFAGAYWGYGFHEDGVRSALKACAAIDPSLTI
ncbi:hypothetical protein BVX97_04440 [bacterium E08(2017)]|nr:hypothetical protein BVX97_04415 [bacterium E08(2017)]OVE75491.1 hypothetical protein BVX97_04440 [bacterium E08(2017)]